MYFQFGIKNQLLLTIFFLISNAEEKWKWDSNSRSNDARRGPASFHRPYDYLQNRPLPQYEVAENNEGIPPRPLTKPHDFRPPVDYRPDILDNKRPINNNYPNRYPPVSGVHVGRPNPSFVGDQFPDDRDVPDILTGPVPSWQKGKEPIIKNYDRCKCSEKFNCPTPGVSFGHCDVGKQYCCYNSKGDPFDGIHANPKKPSYSLENGVLVGPGGSSGIAGRPQPGGKRPYPTGPNTNIHSPENGILIGPGGPFDYPKPIRGQYGQNRPVYARRP